MTTIHYEMTDTFGDVANYSWVEKGSIDIPENLSDLALIRRIKAKIGWSGVRCQKEDSGAMISLKPYGVCKVLFINTCP